MPMRLWKTAPRMAASSRRRKVRTDVDTDRSVQNQMIVMYQTRARASADSAGASKVNTVAIRPPTENVRSPIRKPGDDGRAATGARFRRVPVSSRRTMKPLEARKSRSEAVQPAMRTPVMPTVAMPAIANHWGGPSPGTRRDVVGGSGPRVEC